MIMKKSFDLELNEKFVLIYSGYTFLVYIVLLASYKTIRLK